MMIPTLLTKSTFFNIITPLKTETLERYLEARNQVKSNGEIRVEASKKCQISKQFFGIFEPSKFQLTQQNQSVFRGKFFLILIHCDTWLRRKAMKL